VLSAQDTPDSQERTLTITCEAVVISLPSALSRRAAIGNVLDQRNDIRWHFFDALKADSRVEDLETDEGRQIAKYGRALVPAEIGCFKSHYSVLADFVRSGNTEWILVLEDDVWIDPEFDIGELLKLADGIGISYVRLFAKVHKPAKSLARLSNFRHLIRFLTDPYGTQAYLIRKDGASRFIDGLTSIDVPIDDELGRFWRHGLFPYSVFPFPAVERSVVSSIEVDRSEGTKIRVRYRFDLIARRAVEKMRKVAVNFRQEGRERLRR
jgi:glycosyl transferase, family 25